MPPKSPDRPGYTFTGWDKSSNNIQANTIITAQYTINGYLLTLDGNGGTLEGNTRKEQVLSFNQSFDQVLKDGKDLVSRPGYSFDGWYNSASGEAVIPTAETRCQQPMLHCLLTGRQVHIRLLLIRIT